MAKNNKPPISVKEVAYRLQLSLLNGVSSVNQLYAAGSILSRADYSDVVTERSIASLCGYPLCLNSLPSDSDRRRQKGRYRISLKEHKVYDLRETRMYCSSSCAVDSKAFEASLDEERCAVLDPARTADILGMFGEKEDLESELGFGEVGDLGFSKLKIEERIGESVVGSEEFVGPSNAIEGYVPRRESKDKASKQGSKSNNTLLINDLDFTSIVVTEDEYSVSKAPSSSNKTGFNSKLKNSAEKSPESQFALLDTSYTPAKRNSESISGKWEGESSETKKRNDLGVQKNSADKDSIEEVTEKLSGVSIRSSLKTSEKTKLSRSVTWADEKSDGTGKGKLCEVRAIEGKALGKMKSWEPVSWEKNDEGDSSTSMDVCEASGVGNSDDVLRFASAEACARALNEASEAVASEESGVGDAMSEAGIIVLPPLAKGVEEEPMKEENDGSEPEQGPIKWPKKLGDQQFELFDPDNSWFDRPPDGFNLTLSTFAKMWNTLFTWTTSSTLAYIYGRDESLHEEYLSVNGREYLQKVVLGDGRSSEIKQTLAGSLARALPALASELRLPIPVSSLEQAMGRLLDTMSFVDALPPFRVKQWQVIVLLFSEALSVYRLPSLTQHMTNLRMLIHKVLDGAQVTVEEYELMKDLMIPLGRTPHLSAQSGA